MFLVLGCAEISSGVKSCKPTNTYHLSEAAPWARTNPMSDTPTAFITGAAVRVGRAIALHLAKQGWQICVHYRHSGEQAESLAEEISRAGSRCHLIKGDLADAAQMGELIDTAWELSGGLDCLIHNASVFEKDSLASITPESFQSHQNVNLLAPLLLTKRFAAKRQGKAGGNVITLLDGMLGWSISPNFFSYSLSKLGLQHATEFLALELAPHIRVNGIALGPTIPGALDKPGTFSKLENIIPLGRTSGPEEVCRTIDFILDAPSMTGEVIALSGGVTLKDFYREEW